MHIRHHRHSPHRGLLAGLLISCGAFVVGVGPASADGTRETTNYSREQVQLFETGGGRDTITDFSSGGDRAAMSPIVDDLRIEAEIPPKP
jgi:hypothetical protein